MTVTGRCCRRCRLRAAFAALLCGVHGPGKGEQAGGLGRSLLGAGRDSPAYSSRADGEARWPWLGPARRDRCACTAWGQGARLAARPQARSAGQAPQPRRKPSNACRCNDKKTRAAPLPLHRRAERGRAACGGRPGGGAAARAAASTDGRGAGAGALPGCAAAALAQTRSGPRRGCMHAVACNCRACAGHAGHATAQRPGAAKMPHRLPPQACACPTAAPCCLRRPAASWSPRQWWRRTARWRHTTVPPYARARGCDAPAACRAARGRRARSSRRTKRAFARACMPPEAIKPRK